MTSDAAATRGSRARRSSGRGREPARGAASPRILALATALPPYGYKQEEIRQAAEGHFAGHPAARRLLPVFDSCGVETRYLVRPLPYYLETTDLGERNDAFVEAATELAEACLGRALAAAGLEPRDLDHLIVATTTGVATPSIDALLLHRMGLRLDLERTPLFGIGCAAGGVGLSRAADLARARPGSTVALVTVELCSLTFQVRDLSAKNVIGVALFGDGASCAILRHGEGRGRGGIGASGPRVLAHRSHTFPSSTDVMGWRLSATGLELLLSKELPDLVERDCAELVGDFLAAHGASALEMEHFVVHPGGPRVIDAIEAALGLPAARLDNTRRFLRAHGNLSSSSVLFILADLQRNASPQPGERGLLVAFGPGFSAELVLLGW